MIKNFDLDDNAVVFTQGPQGTLIVHDLNCILEKGKIQLDSKDLIPCGQLFKTGWIVLRNQRNNEIVFMDLAYLGFVGVALSENQEEGAAEEDQIEVEVIDDNEVVEID